MKAFDNYCKDIIIRSLKEMIGKSYLPGSIPYIISVEKTDPISYKYEAKFLLKLWRDEYIKFISYGELIHCPYPVNVKKKTDTINAMISRGISSLLKKSKTFCSLPYKGIILTDEIVNNIIEEIITEKTFY